MRAGRVWSSGLRLAYLQGIQDPKQVRDNWLTRRGGIHGAAGVFAAAVIPDAGTVRPAYDMNAAFMQSQERVG